MSKKVRGFPRAPPYSACQENSNGGAEITPKAASTHRYGNSRGNVAPLALGGFLELTPQKPTEFSSSNAQR